MAMNINQDNYQYSRKELKIIFKRNNLSRRRCLRFLKSVGMEESDSSRTITHKELKTLLLDERDIKLNQIPFHESTIIEGIYALIVSPRCEVGKYYPHDPKGDVDYPWGNHFNKFTPKHSNYYFVNLFRLFLVLMILNFLLYYPIYQVCLITIYICRYISCCCSFLACSSPFSLPHDRQVFW